MRMPEPEEDKATATGGGLRASRLLKLGGVSRSLLKKGLFVLQCTLTESFHAVCCCAFFDRATRLSHLRLRAASNRAQETSEQTYVMIVVNATINNAIQLLLYRENRRSDLRQQAALRHAQETPEQM